MGRFQPISIAAALGALGTAAVYFLDAISISDAAVGLGVSGVLAILGLKER